MRKKIFLATCCLVLGIASLTSCHNTGIKNDSAENTESTNSEISDTKSTDVGDLLQYGRLIGHYETVIIENKDKISTEQYNKYINAVSNFNSNSNVDTFIDLTDVVYELYQYINPQ